MNDQQPKHLVTALVQMLGVVVAMQVPVNQQQFYTDSKTPHTGGVITGQIAPGPGTSAAPVQQRIKAQTIFSRR